MNHTKDTKHFNDLAAGSIRVVRGFSGTTRYTFPQDGRWRQVRGGQCGAGDLAIPPLVRKLNGDD